MFNFYNEKQEDYYKAYKDGFDDCLANLNSQIKKAGKSIYKEFVLACKNKGKRFSSVSCTLDTHNCNCEYCDIRKNK